MTRVRPVPHPSDMGFPTLGPNDLADPALWQAPPVRVLPGTDSLLGLRFATAAGWRPLRLDLHRPATRPGPVPVVVYAHGGSFVGGTRELGPWASLPQRGIAVASVEYRLAGEAAYPEAIEDVLAAIRWVRAHAAALEVDPHRMAGWGSSAGGYLMARAALADNQDQGRPIGDHRETTARLSALVLHYPVVDFTSLLDDALEPTPATQTGVVDVVSRFFGHPMAQLGDQLASASVLAAVAAAQHVPPLHVSHGDADHRCGLQQSRRLVKAWSAANAPAHLTIVPGADHAQPVFAERAVVDPAIEFLQTVWSQGAAAR